MRKSFFAKYSKLRCTGESAYKDERANVHQASELGSYHPWNTRRRQKISYWHVSKIWPVLQVELIIIFIDWVADKQRSRFAFPAICWERSLIPLEIWKVGDTTSNIIEELHQDVNREGLSCTLVGGVKRGLHFDTLKQKTIKVCGVLVYLSMTTVLLIFSIDLWGDGSLSIIQTRMACLRKFDAKSPMKEYPTF